MTKTISTKLFLIICTSVLVASIVFPKFTQALESPILITEVITGYTEVDGTEYPKAELIEIANVTDQSINMDGWRIEYLSAANNGSAPGLIIDTLSSQIIARGQGLWVHDGFWPVDSDGLFGVNDTSSSGLLAKTGGHVRLMNGTTMMDCVAWGSAVVISGCDKVNSLPPAGYSLQRPLSNGVYNKANGVVNLPISAQGGGTYTESSGDVEPETQKQCNGVTITEILANPVGDDGASEFIELFNPSNQSQSLYGCSLKLGTKSYDFQLNTVLEAGEFRAFYHDTTNLQFTNVGAEVVLVTSSQDITVTYPAVGDNEAWAYIDGQWQITNQPTPGSINLASFANITSSGSMSTSETLPCPVGKYRSPETNRCRNSVQATQPLTACGPDQERNPETGRCRKKTVVPVASICPMGQERNQATNRCRKTSTVGTNTKACTAGQERNPDTGRCRKAVSHKASAVVGVATKKTYHLVLVGVMIFALISYGVYEYRHDMRNNLLKLKKRFAKV